MMAEVDHTDAIYEAVVDALRRGEPVALATVVEAGASAPRAAGAKMLVYAGGRTIGTVGGGPSEAWVIDEAREALRRGCPRLLETPPSEEDKDACGRGMRFFVDASLPSPTLRVIGGGHVGQAWPSMGAWLGYRVAVLDERAELVSTNRFPEADVLLSGALDDELRGFPLTEQTYAVLVTPHHSPNEKALSVLSERSVGYVGLLGSSRRTRATFQRARDEGVSDGFLRQIHTPVGLDIHAQTPREIALSILAEITSLRREED